MSRFLPLITLTVLFYSPSLRADEKSIADAIRVIRSVGKEGAGNDAATKASKTLIESGALIPSLEAFSGSTPTAKNWLRSTVATIVDKVNGTGKSLPADLLLAFVVTKSHDPAARAIAFNLFTAMKPKEAKAMLPTFIDDASLELRREAIADRLAKLKDDAGDLKVLFESTRDKDQAEQIAKLLDEKGTKVDLTSHFGYLTTWNVCGPFDSTAGIGFAKSYPPESGFESSKSFIGKGDKSFGWKTISTTAKYGMVDLNKELGKSMDAVAYATAQFESDSERPCDVRVGSKNAVHIYLNGKKLFEREAYHHGFDMDQHTGTGTLKKGLNEVVLKVVQNNQKENWAQDWAFNLRVCDETGGKLPLRNTTPEVKK